MSYCVPVAEYSLHQMSLACSGCPPKSALKPLQGLCADVCRPCSWKTLALTPVLRLYHSATICRPLTALSCPELPLSAPDSSPNVSRQAPASMFIASQPRISFATAYSPLLQPDAHTINILCCLPVSLFVGPLHALQPADHHHQSRHPVCASCRAGCSLQLSQRSACYRSDHGLASI